MFVELLVYLCPFLTLGAFHFPHQALDNKGDALAVTPWVVQWILTAAKM